MDIVNKVVVVTGGASGIGRAMCERFARAGARGVVVADLELGPAQQVAEQLVAADGSPVGMAHTIDVAQEEQMRALVADVTDRYGRIDIFCSNAGIIAREDQDASPTQWQRHWDVNVMAHVHAANAVLPQMLARGQGYLVQTASAAGLLSQVNAAPYSVTKHAAVGFAEWLAIAHGHAGIRVSLLCPQGVLTPMLLGRDGESRQHSFLTAEAVTPEAVADAVLRAIGTETFLILPHPEVLDYWQRKASDYDRWLSGMRRLRARVVGAGEVGPT